MTPDPTIKELEDKIKKIEKYMNDFMETTRKQHKNLIEQVDMNSQTSESLQ